MNNTDKLLRALIDALGYEIEETEVFDEAKYLVKRQDFIDNPEHYQGAFCKSPPFKPAYTEIDYKVTKRKSSCRIVNIEQDGEASFSDDDTPDYCSYPTQLKISIVDGGISVKQVGVNEEWAELSNENI